MRVKAVIMKPDRTNDVVVVKKKDIQGKTFQYANTTYFLHADRFQVTWVRRLGIRKYHSTYYYTEGVPQPLPVPDFQLVKDENGKITFPKQMNLGVSSEELKAIFTPWFYRIIAQTTRDPFAQIQFYLTAAVAVGVAYLIFRIHNLEIPTAQEIASAVPRAPVNTFIPGP